MLNVSEVMTRNPEHLDTTDSVQEATNRLFELDARHLPVTDAAGDLVGIISDRDLHRFSAPYEMQAANAPATSSERQSTPVSDVMSGDVIQAHPEDDITDVIDTMLEHKVGAVPVIDPIEGTLVGIVSYIDILRESYDLW